MLEEIISPLFATQCGKRFSIGALLFTSCCLAFVVVNILWDSYHHYTLLKSSQLSSPVTIPSHLPELITQIPTWHLFGNALDKETLPITSLRIHLTGIITDSAGKSSRAIISEGGHHGKVYQAGDILESGVHVYAVTEDNVVLENGGQLEKLPLRRPPAELVDTPESSIDEASSVVRLPDARSGEN